MTMDEIEQAMILKSLRHHGGNISRVAESLGLSRAALYRRLEKYGSPCEPARPARHLPRRGPPGLRRRLAVWLVWTNRRLAARRSRRCSSLSLAVGCAGPRELFRSLGLSRRRRAARCATRTSRRASWRSASPSGRADRASTTGWSTTCATSACGCRSSTIPGPVLRVVAVGRSSILDFDGAGRQPEPRAPSGCSAAPPPR